VTGLQVVAAARVAAATAATVGGLCLTHPAQAATAQQYRAGVAVRIATAQVGTPYRYGSTGPGSFDCSGLAQYAWRKAGVPIPRTTHAQYALIRRKVSWAGLQPGDLVYFYGRGHVGVYIGRGRMVHAPRSGGRVQIVAITPSWWRATFTGAVRPGA
jgi:cell wall-associated NlpC family hydrolase